MTPHDVSERPPALPTENPFSSRHVRPGATSYRFPPGESVEAILARLEEQQWRGEIVGPHGSGILYVNSHTLPRLKPPSGPFRPPASMTARFTAVRAIWIL